MEETTIFSKSSTDGRAIEIRMYEYLPGSHVCSVYLGGERVAAGVKPQRLNQPTGPITHYIGAGAGRTKRGPQPVKSGLRADEAAQIEGAIQAANAAYRQTLAGRFEALLQEREGLVATIRGAMDEREAAFERHWADEDEAGAFRAQDAGERDVQAARAALRAFDAAQPAVKAKLDADQAATLRRFEAID